MAPNVRVGNVISLRPVFGLAEFNMRHPEAWGAEKTKTGRGGCCGRSGGL